MDSSSLFPAQGHCPSRSGFAHDKPSSSRHPEGSGSSRSPRVSSFTGGFGKVNIVSDPVRGLIAVKQVDASLKEDSCKYMQEVLDREIAVLRKLKHPNIVQFIDASPEQLVMAYGGIDLVTARKGNFEQIHSDQPAVNTLNNEKECLAIAAGIARGLEYLHKQFIVHRDLKPSNVLLNEKGEVRITDFGESCVITPEREGKNHEQSGTPSYRPLDWCLEYGWSVRSDLWSLGCVLYFLHHNSHLFYGIKLTANDQTTFINFMGEYGQTFRICNNAEELRNWVEEQLDVMQNKSDETLTMQLVDYILDTCPDDRLSLENILKSIEQGKLIGADDGQDKEDQEQ